MNDPDSEVFFGTQLSQEAVLPLHQAVFHVSIEALKRPLRQKGLNLEI
jgi:hypothetical protein